jgi:hypothetical protein
MSVTIKTRIGGQLIECTAATLNEAVALASPLAEMPAACTCGSTDIALHRRLAQEYQFFGLLCRGCGREFAIGQRKKPAGEFFPRGPWEHPRRGSDQNNHDDDEPHHHNNHDDDYIPYDPALDDPRPGGNSPVANGRHHERGVRPGN